MNWYLLLLAIPLTIFAVLYTIGCIWRILWLHRLNKVLREGNKFYE